VAVKVFRWKAVGPLLGFALLLVVLWFLFADRVARSTVEDVGTRVLGARVDIKRLHVDLFAGQVSVSGLTVGSPYEAMRNLFEAQELAADIEILPLLEKKVVIRRIAANGMRFGTARTTPGFEERKSDAGLSTGEQVRRDVAQWAEQFDVPALSFVTEKIETGKVDPSQLQTVQAAAALGHRADSTEQALRGALDSLRIGPTVDSVEATVERLQKARATDLAAINDARKTLDQLKRTRDRVVTVERGITTGVASMRAGLDSLTAAKRRDVEAARALLKLPTLDAAHIGAALFGRQAVERFQKALYWAELGRRYMPPGLKPSTDRGPKRLRAAGTNVHFPREHTYPGFLLRQGEISFQLGADAALKSYSGTLTGLTSQPALYGRPATFNASAPSLQIAALSDHVTDATRDTAAATIRGVKLSGFAIPALPLRLEPGAGDMSLAFGLQGDGLRARWSVSAPTVRWVRDSAAGPGSDIEQLVERVLTGIPKLDLAADLRGSLARPALAIRSNLDEAIAGRLRTILGEEVAAAERRIRAQVDSVVEPQVVPLRARVTAAADDLHRRLAEQKARLDAAQKALEQRIRELTRLPGIRLP
jgi:uncharacterized protein (TIGR03545 family)